MERARQQIATSINAVREKEIIFTSGATESNNLAIKGVASYLKQQERLSAEAGKKPKRHIITTEIEHKCVLSSCRELQTGPGRRRSYFVFQFARVLRGSYDFDCVHGRTALAGTIGCLFIL